MLAMISSIPRSNDPNGGRRSEMLLSISTKCFDIGGRHRSEMLYVRRRLRFQPIHDCLHEKLDSMGRIIPLLCVHLLAHVLIFLFRGLLAVAFLLLLLTAFITARMMCGSSRQCFRSCTKNIFRTAMFSFRTESESHASAASVSPVLDRRECPGSRHLVGTIHRQKTISCVMPKIMARDHNQEQRQNQKHTPT